MLATGNERKMIERETSRRRRLAPSKASALPVAFTQSINQFFPRHPGTPCVHQKLPRCVLEACDCNTFTLERKIDATPIEENC